MMQKTFSTIFSSLQRVTFVLLIPVAVANPCDPTKRPGFCGSATIVITGAGEIPTSSVLDSLAQKSKSDLGIFASESPNAKEFLFSSSEDSLPKNLEGKVESYRTSPESWNRFLDPNAKDSAGKPIGWANFIRELRKSSDCEKLIGKEKLDAMSDAEFSKYLKVDISINTHTITDKDDPNYYSIPMWPDDKGSGTGDAFRDISNPKYLDKFQVSKFLDLVPKAVVTGLLDACEGVALGQRLLRSDEYPDQCACVIATTEKDVRISGAGPHSVWALHNTPPQNSEGSYVKTWSGADNAFQLLPTGFALNAGGKKINAMVSVNDDTMKVGWDSLYGNYNSEYGKTPSNPLLGFNKSSLHQMSAEILNRMSKGDWLVETTASSKSVKALATAQFTDQLPKIKGMVDSDSRPVVAGGHSDWAQNMVGADSYKFNSIDTKYIKDGPYDYKNSTTYLGDLVSACFSGVDLSGMAEGQTFTNDVRSCRPMYEFIQARKLGSKPEIQKFLKVVTPVKKVSPAQTLFTNVKYGSAKSAEDVANYFQTYKEFRQTLAREYLLALKSGDISKDVYSQGMTAFKTLTDRTDHNNIQYLERNFDYFQKNAYAVGLAQIKNAGKLLSEYVKQNPGDSTGAAKMLAEFEAQADCLFRYPIGPNALENMKRSPQKDVADSGQHTGARVILQDGDGAVPQKKKSRALDENGQPAGEDQEAAAIR